MKKIRVLVSTHPFAVANPVAAELILQQGWELEFNPYGRKISSQELKMLLPEVDALIAGTEKIDAEVLEYADDLKLISRVGIGLDGIDWNEIKKRNIEVAYTPDAPSLSVAELTLGLMINLLRGVSISDAQMHKKNWKRITGSELSGKTIGIIGLGRVGKKLVKLLQPFGCNIFVNDINPDYQFIETYHLKLVDKETIFKQALIITLHIPLTKQTRNLIDEHVFRIMRHDAFLINTSRGQIVNEDDLYNALKNHQISGAALDVYSQEPYSGPLSECDNIILTCHMGSCTQESRAAMEIGAAQAVVDFFTGKPLKNRVPDELRIADV
ncbi:MAG TPA: phosphoglycerate dehydrogenase [bacterium]|nr:phosphoglycerate dehydrogenase [bacterium]